MEKPVQESVSYPGQIDLQYDLINNNLDGFLGFFWHKTIFNADHCLRVPESHGFKCFGPQVVKEAGFDSVLQEATAVHQVQG